MSTVRAHVATESKLIVNLTRGNVVCEQGVIADRPLRRMRGLLGRRSLKRGDGLLLRPAPDNEPDTFTADIAWPPTQ